MNAFRQLAILLLPALLCVSAPALRAQAAPDVAAQLRQAEADLRLIERQSEAKASDADRALMRARLSTARQAAAAVGKQVSGEVAAVDAQIAELGPPAAAETPDLRKRRADLGAERLALDASAKRASLLKLEAEQLGESMQQLDLQRFSERIARRVASPLLPAFWGTVFASFDADFAKVGRFFAAGWRQAEGRGLGLALFLTLLTAAIAYALAMPVRRAALRLGQRYLVTDAPGHRLRRSAYALWRTLVGTVLPLLAAMAIAAAIGWATAPVWLSVVVAFVFSVGFSAYTAAVLGALLMRGQPSWRIAPIGDAVAERLRPLSWVLAGVSFAASMIQVFNAVIGASPAALAASRAVEAGGSLVLIGGALVALGRIRAAEMDREEATAHAGLSVLALFLWVIILVALLALATGYVELS